MTQYHQKEYFLTLHYITCHFFDSGKYIISGPAQLWYVLLTKCFSLSYSNQQAFLLENVPCNNASCEKAHRMFKVYWDLSDLNQIKDALVATFFDIYEDVSSELFCVFGI